MLSQNPIASSLSVRVNGVVRNGGWFYETGPAMIVFDPMPGIVPADGDLVEGSYQPAH